MVYRYFMMLESKLCTSNNKATCEHCTWVKKKLWDNPAEKCFQGVACNRRVHCTCTSIKTRGVQQYSWFPQATESEISSYYSHCISEVGRITVVSCIQAYQRYPIRFSANNMPVVRNQTFVHIMDWLKLASSENGVNSKVFPLVMDIIIAGITDIWSAIRNTCVAKLSKLLELFTLPQLEDFYGSLVKVLLCNFH